MLIELIDEIRRVGERSKIKIKEFKQYQLDV